MFCENFLSGMSLGIPFLHTVTHIEWDIRTPRVILKMFSIEELEILQEPLWDNFGERPNMLNWWYLEGYRDVLNEKSEWDDFDDDECKYLYQVGYADAKEDQETYLSYASDH